jgi:hypothetical protein
MHRPLPSHLRTAPRAVFGGGATHLQQQGSHHHHHRGGAAPVLVTTTTTTNNANVKEFGFFVSWRQVAVFIALTLIVSVLLLADTDGEPVRYGQTDSGGGDGVGVFSCGGQTTGVGAVVATFANLFGACGTKATAAKSGDGTPRGGGHRPRAPHPSGMSDEGGGGGGGSDGGMDIQSAVEPARGDALEEKGGPKTNDGSRTEEGEEEEKEGAGAVAEQEKAAEEEARERAVKEEKAKKGHDGGGVVDVDAGGGPAPLRPLRLRDVYTEDRCVVYTYYAAMGMGGAAEIDVWKASWSNAGWKPVVLGEQHAALHPKYRQHKALFASMPTVNPTAYELACYLRHLAVAAVGGGTLTDYDVFNVNVPPSPNCDFLPNAGALTTHEKWVPSVVTGNAAAFSGLVENMADPARDWTEVMRATKQPHLSDMIWALYFAYRATPALIIPSTLFLASPCDAPDPPCGGDGEALPMVFHLSHDKMNRRYAAADGGADRAGTMRGEWTRLKDAARARCTPRELDDGASYGAKFWPLLAYPYHCLGQGYSVDRDALRI